MKFKLVNWFELVPISFILIVFFWSVYVVFSSGSGIILAHLLISILISGIIIKTKNSNVETFWFIFHTLALAGIVFIPEFILFSGFSPN